MNTSMKTSVVKSYSHLANYIESPQYMDGIFSKNSGHWDISYAKKNVHGYVTKNGMVKRNKLKVNISEEGKLKPASFRTFLSGKRGLKKINTMLNDIAQKFENPNAADNNSKIQLNLAYKNWRFDA